MSSPRKYGFALAFVIMLVCLSTALVSAQGIDVFLPLISGGSDQAAVRIAEAPPVLTPMEELGKSIFFDENLSFYGNQSCASCHDPAWGWTGPTSEVNAQGAVYEGSIPGAFGNRKPPTAAYGGDSPILYFDEDDEVWVGGMFWDGRATGSVLGDPLADQAIASPFINPVEQALSSPDEVVDRVCASSYAEDFKSVWGDKICKKGSKAKAWNSIGLSIAAYEASSEVNPFTSKYDYWLKGQATLTGQEMWGLEVFEGKGQCSACHPGPLFTDFTYDNLGVPKNPENPVYTYNPYFIDTGLGSFLQSAGYKKVYMAEWGKVKVPTVRNVDLRPDKNFVKAYAHNGYFKSLWEIVHFYNTRDVPGAGWPAPEVAENVNTDELGNLGLTKGEELAIVAFLEMLSDGYVPK